LIRDQGRDYDEDLTLFVKKNRMIMMKENG